MAPHWFGHVRAQRTLCDTLRRYAPQFRADQPSFRRAWAHPILALSFRSSGFHSLGDSVFRRSPSPPWEVFPGLLLCLRGRLRVLRLSIGLAVPRALRHTGIALPVTLVVGFLDRSPDTVACGSASEWRSSRPDRVSLRFLDFTVRSLTGTLRRTEKYRRPVWGWVRF